MKQQGSRGRAKREYIVKAVIAAAIASVAGWLLPRSLRWILVFHYDPWYLTLPGPLAITVGVLAYVRLRRSNLALRDEPGSVTGENAGP